MGIRFHCPACTKRINVKDHQAGKRGFCPKCGARIDIPLTSLLPPKRKDRAAGDDEPSHERGAVATDAPTIVERADALRYEQREHEAAANPGTPAASSPAASPPVGKVLTVSPALAPDPLTEFPQYQWYVAPAPGANPFGPADGPTMRQWLQEGRVAGSAMVWRQDWPEWRPASAVWPNLAGTAARGASPSPVNAATPQGRLLGQYGAIPGTLAAPLAAPHPVAALPLHAGHAVVQPVPSALVRHAVPAAGGAVSAVQPGPVISESPAEGLYYAPRSNTSYLVVVAVLVLVVIGLAALMYFVLTRKPDQQKAFDKVPRMTTCGKFVAFDPQSPKHFIHFGSLQ